MERFTRLQRAMMLAGLAPLGVVGCVPAAQQPAPRLSAALPAPTYRVAVPVPPPPPPPPRALAPTALVTTINGLADAFGGRVGIAVKSIDDDWMVAKNGELALPQQSVSKLWVAMTTLDALDKGRISLDQSVTITRSDLTLFHQPIAALVKDGGYTTTVRDLLQRAMTRSDNTANDRLLKLVGGPASVNAFIADRNLGNIKFGPGERLLQAGTAGLQWKQDMAMGRAFEAARARLPRDVRRAAFDGYVANPPDGAGAAAIANALARLQRGDLLSPASTRWLISTMESSKTGRARLKAGTPAGWSLGHKTGTGQDFFGRTAGFNDIGILTAPNGKSYAIAVLIGDTSRPVPQRQELIQNVAAAVAANHR
ncbi:class A beta-lactamase [Sphingomonas japonica]|uniref:beta-lactamase n=1 Tax=Sphingomonas japonica TaxID=511662 RepID=A0ABX0U181_9SPHN|nr:class A beta-lactamase [Sphingomonas japonica]NIJ23137.1 beta-lactamase class A [Sphingomonas japonica]